MIDSSKVLKTGSTMAIIALALMFVFFIAGSSNIYGNEDKNLQQQAKDIHDRAVVIDTHNDTLMHLVEGNWQWHDTEKYLSWQPEKHLKMDLESASEFGHVDITRLKEGGVNAPVFAVFSSEGIYPDESLHRSLALINTMYHNLKKTPDYMELAKTAADIKNIVYDKNKIAGMLTIEGADFVNKRRGLTILEQYRDLGVRVVGPTWNVSNDIAEGLDSVYSDGSPSHKGLSDFGEEFINKANDLGIVIDVSHLHRRSFWDVLEKSRSPVIASHSSAAELIDHPRNLTDEQIKALKENGGVICITFVREFIAENPEDASIEKIVDHIDHVTSLVGIEHVGLGSDFDGASVPVDLQDVANYPEITEELLKRGYTKKEVKKVLGENILRVLKKAEKNAKYGLSQADYPGMDLITGIETGQDVKRASLSAFNAGVFLNLKSDADSYRGVLERLVLDKLIENKSIIINGQETKTVEKLIKWPLGSRLGLYSMFGFKTPDFRYGLGYEAKDNLERGFNVITYILELEGVVNIEKTEIVYWDS